MLVSVLVLAGGLAGCGGRTHHDDAADTTTSAPAAAATDPDAAAPDALPAGFPDDVPVVKGTIDGKSVSVPGSAGKIWMLTVTGIDAGAYDTAERLLLDAGFTRPENPGDWKGERCDRESQFHKELPGRGSYIGHVCGVQAGDDYRLSYTINVYPENDWQLPSLPNLPSLPTSPGPPEPPR